MNGVPISQVIKDEYSSNDILLNKLRTLVSKIMEIGEYKTASFWLNKILSFTNSNKNDVYQQAKCFFHLKEYHRASHCIKSHNLHKTDLACRHLAAKCHVSLPTFFELLESSKLILI